VFEFFVNSGSHPPSVCCVRSGVAEIFSFWIPKVLHLHKEEYYYSSIVLCYISFFCCCSLVFFDEGMYFIRRNQKIKFKYKPG
jgi:hypothetical protein